MRWNVNGADVNTGKELTLTIDAPDRGEAERQVQNRGILIREISPHPEQSPTLDYRSPAKATPTPKPTKDHVELFNKLSPDTFSARVFLICVLWLVIILLIGSGGSDLTASSIVSISERFDSENAIGAAANRLGDVKIEIQNGIGVLKLILATLIALFCLFLSRTPAKK